MLRKIYEKEKIKEEKGYPEQFDITFDFVPRMCDNKNCEICPYGNILYNRESGKGKDFDKICIKNKNYYCPVLLACCNYKIKCYGLNCELLKLVKMI